MGLFTLRNGVAEIVQKIVFLWENFGPYHIDRLNSVSGHFSKHTKIIGIELAEKSEAYAWEAQVTTQFERMTLAKDQRHFFEHSLFWQLTTLLKVIIDIGRADFFFCHYERPAIFLTALLLRLAGRRVYVMNDMKFADFKRNIPREVIKSVFHAPYCGALAAGRRSADYFRFLGIPETQIKLGYGAVSITRLESAIENSQSLEFSERPFIVVARFMPMKNLFAIIEAYRLYHSTVNNPRKLHLCGSGPLESDLRRAVQKSGLDHFIVFRGFLQADDVTRAIAASLCLILFSTQETFGNVIIESLALGVPVIASPICGATDEFLKSGQNGFLVEPDNIEGLAIIMKLIDGDEAMWNDLRRAAFAMRSKIDIANFSAAIAGLIRLNSELNEGKR